uniref:RNase H type-1 domain-containing protein n=1 Tax=Biomphalaria glabrata TaxID=6526 RepID=A0A2C9KVF7_BIOGL
MALDALKTYPAEAIYCYTDGSVMKDPVRAGYGAYICYPDHEPDKLSGTCGLAACSFDAELTAITNTLNYVLQKLREKITVATTVVMVTDSQSCLQAMADLGGKSKLVEEALGAANNIRLLIGAVIVMQWVPSHCGLIGNAVADALEREGALAVPTFESPSTFQQATTTIREW